MTLDALLNALDVQGHKLPEINAFRVTHIHNKPVYNNRLPKWIKYALRNAGLNVELDGYVVKIVER